MNGTHLMPEKAQFFTTSARPGNFREHIDFTATIDNWFDENRVYNEHETDIRRTQIYTLSAVYFGGVMNFARLVVIGAIGRLNGWTRYDRNTYMEVEISELPPGEVLQIDWIFEIASKVSINLLYWMMEIYCFSIKLWVKLFENRKS